jgi:hypothetical protein
MGFRVIGAPCDSGAISPDYTKYLLWTGADRRASQHPESRQQDVVSGGASCIALKGSPSVGVVNQ